MLRNRAGFTLVEILISLAILAMIVASTFTIFRSSSKSWQKGETRSERYHNARTAIGKMSMELSQAVMKDGKVCKFTGEESRVGFLSFVSSSSGVFEIAEIEYWLDKGRRLLLRNEDIEPDYDFLTQDQSDILVDNISELEFSYYDGMNWNGSWNSDSILPKAVKIKIKLEDKTGKESEEFGIVAHLKTS